MTPQKKALLAYALGGFLFAAPFLVMAEGITHSEASQLKQPRMFKAEDYTNTKSVLPLVTNFPNKVSVKKQSSTATFRTIGRGKLPFTDSSVTIPKANITFPYNAIGRLEFIKSNGSPGVCTASIVRPSIVITAGHCLHSGNNTNSGYSEKFKFMPGYYKGNMPYGEWKDIEYRAVAPDWYKSGGKTPHPTDYGILIFNKNSDGKRIGDVVTWLGYWPDQMVGSHVTVLGYAKNLDKGQILHRVDANVAKGLNNTGVFGSNMAAEADGSPVILNFGEPSAGDPAGWANRDLMVSVASFSDSKMMTQGGSVFDNRFTSFLDNACTLYPWACH